MLELAKIIHEAIGIQHRWVFIALFAVSGFCLFGAVGWLIDKGYRVKLQELAKNAPAAIATPSNQISETKSLPPQSEAKGERKKVIDNRKVGANNIYQTMKDSPGGIQVGGSLNVNVNTDRKISDAAAKRMIDGLKANPCLVTVGVLGMGGEPEQLANQIFQIVENAVSEVRGINHGIGFKPFSGILLLYSPVDTPKAAVDVISRSLSDSKLEHAELPDPSQPPGSVYIYVGYKP